jgi:hypothetical protein
VWVEEARAGRSILAPIPDGGNELSRGLVLDDVGVGPTEPEKAEELSPAEWAQLLGGPGGGNPPVRFHGEGRWQARRPEP